MNTYNDKDRIGFWLRLYNRLESETYVVESWPDDDKSKKNNHKTSAYPALTGLG
jgi:hypothetical protein